MILKLTGYPVITDGREKGAETQEELLFVATLMRWILLNESDWTQLQDTNMGPTLKQEWAVFRQYLRDLPSTFLNEFSANDAGRGNAQCNSARRWTLLEKFSDIHCSLCTPDSSCVLAESILSANDLIR